MSDEWVEAGSASGNTWDEKEPLTGVLVRKQENVGPNNSRMYHIEVAGEEDTTGVWGSTVLDNKFSEIPIGSMVKVESLGKVQGKRGTYKDYKVLYKAPDGWADEAAEKVDAQDQDKSED